MKTMRNVATRAYVRVSNAHAKFLEKNGHVYSRKGALKHQRRERKWKARPATIRVNPLDKHCTPLDNPTPRKSEQAPRKGFWGRTSDGFFGRIANTFNRIRGKVRP